MPKNYKNLFKYLDFNGATASLQNGTLKFTSPVALNDPFDVSIQSLFDYDHLSVENHTDAFLDLLYSKEIFPAHNGTPLAMKFEYMRKYLKPLTKEERLEIRNEMIEAKFVSIESLCSIADQTLDHFQLMFDSSGIFCASKRHDNQLLWAHYADKHKGAVLEFEPNVEKDSMLILAEEITYTEERPFLYKSNRDHWYKSIFYEMNDVLRAFTKQITTTKNPNWAYEEELRVYQPMLINVLDNQDHKLQTYHNEELVRVYLGAKMPAESKMKIAKDALSRNPQVEVIEMKLNRQGYEMSCQPFVAI